MKMEYIWLQWDYQRNWSLQIDSKRCIFLNKFRQMHQEAYHSNY